MALEVNGPQHYFENVPHEELAWMKVRKRVLEKIGWRVVPLRGDEWDMLPSWEEKKEAVR